MKLTCNLTKVSLPSGLQFISPNCFENSALQEINIPESVRKFGKYAFSGCMQLTDISIPEELEEIGEYCFQKSGLIEVSIPRKV